MSSAKQQTTKPSVIDDRKW